MVAWHSLIQLSTIKGKYFIFLPLVPESTRKRRADRRILMQVHVGNQSEQSSRLKPNRKRTQGSRHSDDNDGYKVGARARTSPLTTWKFSAAKKLSN